MDEGMDTRQDGLDGLDSKEDMEVSQLIKNGPNCKQLMGFGNSEYS